MSRDLNDPIVSGVALGNLDRLPRSRQFRSNAAIPGGIDPLHE